MDDIIRRIAEIEETAEKIVENAQNQKFEIEREIQNRRDEFDRELEDRIAGELETIKEEGRKKTDKVLEQEHQKHHEMIDRLEKEFAEHHTEYAEQILKRLTEV